MKDLKDLRGKIAENKLKLQSDINKLLADFVKENGVCDIGITVNNIYEESPIEAHTRHIDIYAKVDIKIQL